MTVGGRGGRGVRRRPRSNLLSRYVPAFEAYNIDALTTRRDDILPSGSGPHRLPRADWCRFADRSASCVVCVR
jgi:hypothetical protein